jgi:hypothetical protein
MGIISRCCSANPPRAAIPGTAGELCGEASVNSVTLCRPLPYDLHAAPRERGRRNPRKEYGRLPRARTRLATTSTPEARFVRTTINSVSLYTIPLHVALALCGTIVNRLHSAYKRRRRSPGRGGRRIATYLHVFRLHHDIGTSPQSNLRDLEASPPLLPRL